MRTMLAFSFGMSESQNRAVMIKAAHPDVRNENANIARFPKFLAAWGRLIASMPRRLEWFVKDKGGRTSYQLFDCNK